MKFMHLHRRLLSLIALAAFTLAGAASPAAGYYNPTLGRFMSADPNGQAVVVSASLSYHAANPVVTVNRAYTLQYADGMSLYEYVRSNPAVNHDPSGLFSLAELLYTAGARAHIGAMNFAAAHPLAMKFTAGLLAAVNLYAFAKYQEVQAIVVAQPDPLGLMAAEAAAVRMALQQVLRTGGSARALVTASAETRALVATANQTMPSAVAQDTLATVRISRSRWPEAAAHIEAAQAAGQPRVLTIDRTGAAGRRQAAQRGHGKIPGLDLDEYPPAMFKEGGQGASVRPISTSDNRGAGSYIRWQAEPYANGTRVLIEVVP